MNSDIKHIIIDNDLEVEIEALSQFKTYRNVIYGYPTERRNNWLIKDILESAHKTNNPQSVYLIQPEHKIMDDIIRKNGNPLDICKVIPDIECHLEVRSKKIFTDENESYSKMLIIWFQDEFAFPIDPIIIEKIKTIPYRKLCFSFEL